MIKHIFIAVLFSFSSLSFANSEWASILINTQGNGIVKYSANPKRGFKECKKDCVIRVKSGSEIKISASMLSDNNFITLSNCDKTFANKFCRVTAHDNRKITIDFNHHNQGEEIIEISKKFIKKIKNDEFEDIIISSRQIVTFQIDEIVSANFDFERFKSTMFNVIYDYACSINFKNNFPLTQVVLKIGDSSVDVMVNSESCSNNSILKIKDDNNLNYDLDFEDSIILTKDFGSYLSIEVDYRFDISKIKDKTIYLSQKTRMKDIPLKVVSSKINKYGNHVIQAEIEHVDEK